MMPDVFDTERLLLRPTGKEDAAFILELLNEPKWLHFIGDRKIRTIEDAEQYVSTKMTPQLERLGYANYTIIRKEDGVKVGTCGLFDREGLDGVDIGYSLLERYEKQGYAIESAKKILDLAFHQFGLTQINAITTKDNTASQRLLEKLGLCFRKMIRIPNDEEELKLYSVKKK